MSFNKYKRNTARALRLILGAAYAFVAWAGFSALAFPIQSTAEVLPTWLSIMWAVIALAGGTYGLVSIIYDRWRWEFMAAPLASAGIFCYAITVWSMVHITPSRMTQGGVILAAGLLLLYRTVELFATADLYNNAKAV